MALSSGWAWSTRRSSKPVMQGRTSLTTSSSEVCKKLHARSRIQIRMRRCASERSRSPARSSLDTRSRPCSSISTSRMPHSTCRKLTMPCHHLDPTIQLGPRHQIAELFRFGAREIASKRPTAFVIVRLATKEEHPRLLLFHGIDRGPVDARCALAGRTQVQKTLSSRAVVTIWGEKPSIAPRVREPQSPSLCRTYRVLGVFFDTDSKKG